jgi:porin
VLREHPDEPEDEQRLSVFGQYGWAPEDRSEAAQYLGAGLQWVGAIPTRDLDTVGLGAFHVIFSDEGDFADDYETAIELFYGLQLCDWLNLKPDLQYIIHPGGVGNPNSLVLGVRTQVSF